MNREMRRLMEREERRQKKQEKAGATARRTPAASARPAPAERKPLWIDFNAGVLVEGTSRDELLQKFIHYVLKVASGEPVNNEMSDFREIAIFKSGVTL